MHEQLKQEPEDATPPTPETSPMTPSPKGPLSRRDFLRRAGKEAADTGAKILPGAQAAKAVLGFGQTEKDSDGKEKPLPWWKRIARWRAERTDPPRSDDAAQPEKTEITKDTSAPDAR